MSCFWRRRNQNQVSQDTLRDALQAIEKGRTAWMEALDHAVKPTPEQETSALRRLEMLQEAHAIVEASKLQAPPTYCVGGVKKPR